MNKLIALCLAAVPLSGLLAVVSNGFALDTRPSPQIQYGVVETFSTRPPLVLLVR